MTATEVPAQQPQPAAEVDEDAESDEYSDLK
jgi:hypothetical protein